MCRKFQSKWKNSDTKPEIVLAKKEANSWTTMHVPAFADKSQR